MFVGVTNLSSGTDVGKNSVCEKYTNESVSWIDTDVRAELQLYFAEMNWFIIIKKKIFSMKEIWTKAHNVPFEEFLLNIVQEWLDWVK